MENNDLRPTCLHVKPATDTGDWRAEPLESLRQRTIKKIMEAISKHLPTSDPERLRKIRRLAAAFEERVFTSAESKIDYLFKICTKTVRLESKYQESADELSALISDADKETLLNPEVVEVEPKKIETRSSPPRPSRERPLTGERLECVGTSVEVIQNLKESGERPYKKRKCSYSMAEAMNILNKLDGLVPGSPLYWDAIDFLQESELNRETFISLPSDRLKVEYVERKTGKIRH